MYERGQKSHILHQLLKVCFSHYAEVVGNVWAATGGRPLDRSIPLLSAWPWPWPWAC